MHYEVGYDTYGEKKKLDSLRSYFRPDTSIKQMTETLVKAMEFYNKHLERQRRDRDAR